jgi:hypothetical protein
LWKAFENRKEHQFDQWLEIGANPSRLTVGNDLSTFEMLCQDAEASNYILKCLNYKTDPNRVSRPDVYLVHCMYNNAQSLVRKTITMDTIQYTVLLKI